MTGYTYRDEKRHHTESTRPAVPAGNGMKVGLVRVDDILFHPHNVRRDLGDLRNLAESIASFGVMQPVVVERYGQQLRLRAGHRRVAAAKIAKLTRIPAIIHDEKLDDENWLIHSVQENVMRRQLDREEQTRTAQALLDLGCSRAGVAEVFGVGVSTIAKWLNPEEPKGQSKPYVRKLAATALCSWVKSWRAELDVRDVTAAELLDQLARVAEASAIRGTLPADLAAATAERVA